MELQELVERIQRWKRRQSADYGAYDGEEAGSLGQTADSSGTDWEEAAGDSRGDVHSERIGVFDASVDEQNPDSRGKETSRAEISDADIVADRPIDGLEPEEDTQDFPIDEAIDLIEEK